MQLWQMDIMGGVLLDDGTELKIVTGIDDHCRFCVAAGLVERQRHERCAKSSSKRCSPMGCRMKS